MSCRFRVGLGGRFTAQTGDSDCGVTEWGLMNADTRLQHSRYVYCNPVLAAAYVLPVRRTIVGCVVEFGTVWYAVSVILRATGHTAMENTCG